MTPENAVELLSRFALAAFKLAHSDTKKAAKTFDEAAADCFEALAGRKPTAEELAKIGQ